MLKVIDNVDLRELENFGFADECSDYFNFYQETTWCIVQIRVVKITRIIQVFVCTGDEDCSVSTGDVFDKLFDLFSVGLVEKVGDNYKKTYNIK